MEFLKELFDKAGALSWEQFSDSVNKKGYKLFDLSGGKYVDKDKYVDDISARDTEISGLNEKITLRDADITELKKQLEDAGNDRAKLATITQNLAELQHKYENETAEYKAKLERNARMAIVKDIADREAFSSVAAKKMFINDFMDMNLTLDGDKFLGGEDFVKSYKEANADSFVQAAEPTRVPHFTVSTNPQIGDETITKEAFKKMSYSERNELYNTDKALYDELSKE